MKPEEAEKVFNQRIKTLAAKAGITRSLNDNEMLQYSKKLCLSLIQEKNIYKKRSQNSKTAQVCRTCGSSNIQDWCFGD